MDPTGSVNAGHKLQARAYNMKRPFDKLLVLLTILNLLLRTHTVNHIAIWSIFMANHPRMISQNPNNN